MKKVFNTSITKQDSSSLAEFLLERGREVHSIKHRASSFNTQRGDHIYQNGHVNNANFMLCYGKLTDSSHLTRILREIEPNKLYNFGAQNQVAVSFKMPEYSAEVDAIGTLYLLEAIRFLGLEEDATFYQASTSELFGLVKEIPQRETSPFHPSCPYAVDKMYAYWLVVKYWDASEIYACNAILFKHESRSHCETVISRRITCGLSKIPQGFTPCLYMENIDSVRDWAQVKEYLRVQLMMLQQDTPEDSAIATGKQYAVRAFISSSARDLGATVAFSREGNDEMGNVNGIKGDDSTALKEGVVIVRIDTRYFFPAEVETSRALSETIADVLSSEDEPVFDSSKHDGVTSQADGHRPTARSRREQHPKPARWDRRAVAQRFRQQLPAIVVAVRRAGGRNV